MNDNALPIGSLLNGGAYRIEEKISSGGFGNTYVVRNMKFKGLQAMKEFFMKDINLRNGTQVTVSIPDNRATFESQREKFKKEAQRLWDLSDRHIVKVYDWFEENGTVYFVMDLIDGQSLADIIKSKGAFDEQTAMNIFRQMLEALSVVHGQDEPMFHLDIKPANIMLDKRGNAYLIDFGSSKQIDKKNSNSTSTAFTYTPGYAPPEVIDGNKSRIGPWSDLYELGATLYHILTGHQPPIVSEIQEFGEKAFSFPNGISDDTRKLILWLMALSRANRPKSVAEVMHYIERTGKTGNPGPKGPSPAAKKPTGGERAKGNTGGDTTILHPLVTRGGEKPTTPPQKKVTNSEKGSNNTEETQPYKHLIYYALAAVVGGLIVWGVSSGSRETDSDNGQTEVIEKPDTIKTVTNSYFKSALGVCSYTGQVDDNGHPHGTGECIFIDGRLYRGPFYHGNMTGENAYFRYDNGDIFEGSFSGNRFYKGRYTLKEDGSYFEGTFKNGQPDNGIWYDKRGNKI